MSTSRLVKSVRSRLGLSLREFGSIFLINFTAVSRWETQGRVPHPLNAALLECFADVVKRDKNPEQLGRKLVLLCERRGPLAVLAKVIDASLKGRTL